jgi:hypothetical protein
MNMIEMVLSTPCTTQNHPEFKFKLSAEAVSHNLNILSKYYYDLDKALNAQQEEFKPARILKTIFTPSLPCGNAWKPSSQMEANGR